MNLKLLWLVLGVMVAVVACGDDGVSPSTAWSEAARPEVMITYYTSAR